MMFNETEIWGCLLDPFEEAQVLGFSATVNIKFYYCGKGLDLHRYVQR